MSEFLTPQNDDSLIIAILSTFKIFLHRGVQKEYCDFWAGDWRYCRCYDNEFTHKEKYRLQEIFLNEYIEIFMQENILGKIESLQNCQNLDVCKLTETIINQYFEVEEENLQEIVNTMNFYEPSFKF